MSYGPRPTTIPSGILISPSILAQQMWAENWGLCHFGGGGAGSLSTQCDQDRGLSACQIILIHPTVWPQYTNVTDRTDSQTDRTERRDRHTDRQLSDSKRSPKNHIALCAYAISRQPCTIPQIFYHHRSRRPRFLIKGFKFWEFVNI